MRSIKPFKIVDFIAISSFAVKKEYIEQMDF
jgi:hypothetical protein